MGKINLSGKKKLEELRNMTNMSDEKLKIELKIANNLKRHFMESNLVEFADRVSHIWKDLSQEINTRVEVRAKLEQDIKNEIKKQNGNTIKQESHT